MSPTYWTSSQIIDAAKRHGWRIVPIVRPDGPWELRQGRFRVQIKERRDGGLSWVSFTYPMSGGSNCDYLGPRYSGKLAEVLAFLRAPHMRALERQQGGI